MNNYPLLDSISYPDDLRRLSLENLPALVAELRAFLLECIENRWTSFVESRHGGTYRGLALCVQYAKRQIGLGRWSSNLRAQDIDRPA